jgi:peptidyl-prolyl cis-trans isomerase D
MLKSIQQRDLDKNRWIKVTMAVVLGIICLSMVVTLVPGLVGGAVTTDNSDVVATIGTHQISITDLQRQLDQVTRNQQIPDSLRGLYTKQILNDMIFQQELYLEADRLNVNVTPDEETERIKQIVPAAWSGNTWLKDRYTQEVQTRTGLSVPEFETALRDDMLSTKMRQVVTGGLTVTPGEVARKFQLQNEKIKVDYVVVKPSDLASTIHPSDADLQTYFQKNSSKYQIPEKRTARYALLDLMKLRASTKISDDELRTYYNAHLDEYKVPNRVHPEHILFKTVGKTDAEAAEIRKQAEDVLKQAKKGSNFEDLAKKYSEDDGSKPKGGDLGWIVEGQTVPEFQQAAFSLPKGQISDLVKTQYGFHIIKVLDRETAHTKSLDEVRDSINMTLLDQKVSAEADDLANQMAAAVRQSDRQPLDDIAKKFNLQVGDTGPVGVSDPVGPLGNTPDLHGALFELHQGELSQPLHLDQGYVILTVTGIQPAHQAMIAEAHDKVLADYQHDKSIDLAATKAQDLAKQAQSGSLDKAAKALGLDSKVSIPFARYDTVPDIGTASQIQDAFTMKIGQVSNAMHVGENWVVYQVAEHNAPNPDDLAKQSKTISDQLLNAKQQAAYDAFRTSLDNQLKKEGKVTTNDEAVRRFSPNS